MTLIVAVKKAYSDERDLTGVARRAASDKLRYIMYRKGGSKQERSKQYKQRKRSNETDGHNKSSSFNQLCLDSSSAENDMN